MGKHLEKTHMKKRDLKILTSIMLVLFISVTCITCATQQDNSGKKVSAEAAKIAPLFKSANFQDDKGNNLPYRYFEPTINESESAKYPVILYLHGEGEAGTDNTAQLTTTECATIWVEPDHLALNPVYVLAPQAPAGSDWTTEPLYSSTLALLNQFTGSHPKADTKRIYIVGFSMGGNGVWNMILKNPKLFAAAMPISGNADKYLGDYDAWAALKNMPIIVIHSYDDTVSPISGSINAIAALRAGGNRFAGTGGATPCLWSPGSVSSPHDAWWTAFHKFEVVYNSLFWGNLEKTNNGEISPTMLYTKSDLGNGVTRVWDYALGTAWVIERPEKAVIIDVTMGQDSIYQFIKDNILVNKDIDIEIIVTHQHNDHIRALSSFVGAAQLKSVYVHKEESLPVIRLLGPDAAKVKLVKDGDLIPLGGKNIEIIEVPGHSLGCIVMLYDNYMFSGDSIGTGYVGVGAISVEQYIQSVQHLLDRMGNNKYSILGGHTGECRTPMTEPYVHELMSCARGLVDGSIVGPPYWRSGESSTRKVATVGGASITYDINNVRYIKGALRSLAISEGSLNPPRFAAHTTHYSASVDAKADAIAITPTVMAKDYKGLTINGAAVASGDAYKASLIKGENRFSITVTASDNATRTYTLTIARGM
jgi:glyoxylase-like metal-dependent hydrolase (beta-lactamase superfamily II)/predicted esterase